MDFDKNSPVGILDSGVGGLTAAAEVINRFKNESVIYIGDSLNMPYGNKEEDEIVYLAERMIAFLENKGVKVILLACNTISSLSQKLNSNIKLINIVEAGAIDIAQACEDNENVGLIATKATVNGKAYEKAVMRINPTIKLHSKASSSLPKVIDSHLDDINLLNEKIHECIDPIVNECAEISKLVLGCSHFPIISSEISDVYPNLKLIDPAIKQAELLGEYLAENNLISENANRNITLYTTAETYEYAAAIKRLNLEVDALIKVSL